MTDTSLTEAPSSAAPSAAAALLALADRCEREERSMELDARIHAAINGFVGPDWDVRFTRSCLQYTAQKKGESQRLLYCEIPFTTSLDAAVTLLPSDDENRLVFWRVGNDAEGGDPADFKAEVLVAGLLVSPKHTAVAASAAMAFCAACLKARAALVQS